MGYLTSYRLSMLLCDMDSDLATVETQIFVNSALAQIIAVNLVKILVLHDSFTSSTLSHITSRCLQFSVFFSLNSVKGGQVCTL